MSAARNTLVRPFWAMSLALISVLLFGATAVKAGDPGLQHLVLITIDALRADHIGAYGGVIPTPALDALAADGVVFERAATPIPTTGPAIVSLMTGAHPWRHGTLANAEVVDPRIPKLAERLAGLGFDTAAFVSSYFVQRRFGFNAGFGTFSFEPIESHVWRGSSQKFWSRGEKTVAMAMDWITGHTEKPFFVWVHLFDPHTPYQPPVGFAISPDHRIDMEGKKLPPGIRKFRELERRNRAYLGEVAYVDAQVGKLIERLRLLELLDKTAVVVTSDHGEGLGDHGLLEHGRNVFEELVRVPLIIRAPGVPAGRRLDGPAQLEDLAPTIFALAGATDSFESDGFDLGPWLRGESERSPREWILGQRRAYGRRGPQYFARKGSYKWIGRLGEPGEVFSLESDPRELAGKPGSGAPEVLRQSVEQARDDASRSDAERRPPSEEDAEVSRALEELGYSEMKSEMKSEKKPETGKPETVDSEN